MAFKYKPYRIKFSQECKTLDELHVETTQKFDNINKQIDKLQKKIYLLSNKIKDNNNYTDEEINNIKKNIDDLNQKIINIQINNDELEYYEKTKDVLIQYYENSSKDNLNDIPDEIIISNDNNINSINFKSIVINTNITYTNTNTNTKNLENTENIKNIDTKNIDTENIDTENTDTKNIDTENTDTDNINNTDDNICENENNNIDILDIPNDIMDRFNKLNKLSNKEKKYKNQIKKHNFKKIAEKKSILSFLSFDNSGNTISEPVTQIIHEKGTLKDLYLCLTDSSYVCNKVKLSPIKNCKNCNSELTLMQSEGYFVCQNCSQAEYVVVESEIPSHKNAMNEKPKYPYNPINHLIEKLNQYQAKQTTIIPQNIYELVKNELKKRMIPIDDVNPELVQKILKKYRKDIYYEHHFLIFSYITGTPPPSLTRDEEEDIKKMFKMTEKPFKLFKPDSRENYLNYSYVLNKLFLIKAHNDNNPKMAINAIYFKLLKSRDKLRIQDYIWKQICKYLNWPFHPSY
jgi:hypothetical protein